MFTVFLILSTHTYIEYIINVTFGTRWIIIHNIGKGKPGCSVYTYIFKKKNTLILMDVAITVVTRR